jgi:hypothetical protein
MPANADHSGVRAGSACEARSGERLLHMAMVEPSFQR